MNYCHYDIHEGAEAKHTCYICHVPLCDSCGYIDESGKNFCNDCWKEIQLKILEKDK